MLYRQNLDLLSKLPSWWIPEPILSEPHLYEIGKRLSMEGIIGLKPAEAPNDANTPSHLFTLNVPLQDAVNYPEHEAIKQLEQDRKRKQQDPVSQNCVVFSSLALLRTLCDVANPLIMGQASEMLNRRTSSKSSLLPPMHRTISRTRDTSLYLSA